MTDNTRHIEQNIKPALLIIDCSEQISGNDSSER